MNPDKYQIAHSKLHNCTHADGHHFIHIEDKKVIQEILEQIKQFYPGIGLWKCMSCGKISQSM